jgi:hypothetical protein
MAEINYTENLRLKRNMNLTKTVVTQVKYNIHE